MDPLSCVESVVGDGVRRRARLQALVLRGASQATRSAGRGRLHTVGGTSMVQREARRRRARTRDTLSGITNMTLLPRSLASIVSAHINFGAQHMMAASAGAASRSNRAPQSAAVTRGRNALLPSSRIRVCRIVQPVSRLDVSIFGTADTTAHLPLQAASLAPNGVRRAERTDIGSFHSKPHRRVVLQSAYANP